MTPKSQKSFNNSDLSSCNRNHLELAKRMRCDIEAAGAICFEFQAQLAQATVKCPDAALDQSALVTGQAIPIAEGIMI